MTSTKQDIPPTQDIVRTPSYYVRKRLFSNVLAVAGLVYIILACIVALLGYFIMPDSTPNVNERADEISLQKPGFQVLILKIRQNREIPKVNLFQKWLFGQESEYRIKPIESYRIQGLDVFVKVFAQGGTEVSYSLVDLTKPLYVGETNLLGGKKFEVQGNVIRYVDVHGKIQTTTREELISEFEKKCLEKRTYWLGTDKAGRDVLSRLIFGVRISLGIGIVSVIISLLVGVTLGSIAGFFGGIVDSLVMWLMTVIWSIPGIMLVIAISLALGKGVLVAFIAIGLTTWVEIARVVRGQIMSIKQKQFVEAARALGMNNAQIIFRHVLPNTTGPVIVIMTSNFASAILTEAGLSFLGLSARPPVPSWGNMVNEGLAYITTDFHLVLFPSLCIALMVLAFNLFGNGLRDAYDPKGK
ncbi:MAG: ABC transporter permease [Microscillaceae bacterium]|nr:ABC transporter permease [Microscillaceae bacterium]MDW8460912.1 ABC transporter permease [Cytophagales bacterium]